MRAERVEDGHSATQNSVYWYLWRSGREVKGSRSRFIQIGYGQLQAALGVDRSNIQDALRELQKKLSVRIVQGSTVGTATIYEVVSCEEILALRQEQGMHWVRRFGTRRADFVTEDELSSRAIDNGIAAAPPTGVAPTALAPPAPSPSGNLPTVGFAPTVGVGLTPIHSVKEVSKPKTTSAPFPLNPDEEAAVDHIEQRILKTRFAAFDRQAIRMIWRQGREVAPDVSAEEVFLVFEEKATSLSGNRNVENLNGLVLYAWQGFFTLGRLLELRKRLKSQRDDTDRQRQEMIRMYQEGLHDPDETVRQLARDGLRCLNADADEQTRN